MFAPSKLPGSVIPKCSIASRRVVAEHLAHLRRASRRRTCPRRPRSRRRARRRTRPRPGGAREREVERLAAHALEQRVAGDLPGVQVGAGEQRVVVEHLLEVRDEPGAVDRVAGEAAADLVVHAAARHPAQGVQRHLALPAAEQELDRRGGRELRRAPEAAVLRRRRACAARHRRVERGRVDLVLRRLDRRRAAQALDDRAGLAADLLALLVPRRADRRQHVGPARQPWRGSAGSRCRTRTARRRG